MTKRHWPLAVVLILLIPAMAVSFYYFIKTPTGAQLMTRFWQFLEKNNIGSSVGRQYLTRQPIVKSTPQFVPDLIAKEEGIWIVGPKENGHVDTDQLHHALANARAGNTIKIHAGSYRVPLVKIEQSLIIEALDKEAPTIILEDQWLIDGSKERLKVVMKNIKFRSERPYYAGTTIEVKNATLELSQVSYLGLSEERAIHLRNNSRLEGDKITINPSDRGQGIFLSDISSLDINELTIFNPKEGISGDIHDFKGEIILRSLTIKNARGTALSLYGGTLKAERMQIEGGLSALLLRRNADAQIRLAQFSRQELYGIDVGEDSQLRLFDSQLEDCGQIAILVQKNDANVQIIQTTIAGADHAVFLSDRSRLEFVASTLLEQKKSAVMAGKNAKWSCQQSKLTGNGGNIGIGADGAMIKLDECRFEKFQTAISLKNESRLEQVKTSYHQVQKNLERDQTSDVEVQRP